MNERLKSLLEHLHRVLDEGRQRETEDLFVRTLNWERVGRLPLVMSYPPSDEMPFRPYPHSAVFDDPEKMLYNELVHAFDVSVACRDRLRDDLPCTVRANFGTVLVASMFGARIQQVGDNPPWVVHDDGRPIPIEAVLDHDPFDLSKGWCPRVTETYTVYNDILGAYPDLRKIIKLVLPDLQGPFDNLELIAGSGIFAELCVNETLVRGALESVASTQIAMAHHLSRMITDGPSGFSHQHAHTIKGRILLRNDSVIMMSPRMYRDQIAVHDERVLREFGGGIHCCGNVGAHAQAFLEIDGVLCLDLGQPEMNDLDRIYALAKPKRIPIVRAVVSEEELVTGSVLERFPTGVTLLHRARSLTDAARIADAYRRASEAIGDRP